MNQNGFPPLYCFDCELDIATYEERLRAWRKANAGRGRYYTVGKPERPRGCAIDVLAPCCGQAFNCGEKHGHPTDEEEVALHDKFDRLIWGTPDDYYNRGTMYRGLPTGECSACDEPATNWTRKNHPVCRACYAAIMTRVMQRESAS